MKTKYNNLHGWVITYNEYTQLFDAVKRENYTSLFSGPRKDVLSSDDINTLILLIEKTNGNKSKLNKLIK